MSAKLRSVVTRFVARISPVVVSGALLATAAVAYRETHREPPEPVRALRPLHKGRSVAPAPQFDERGHPMSTVSGNTTTASNVTTGGGNGWSSVPSAEGAPDSTPANNDFVIDLAAPTDELHLSATLTVPLGATITGVSASCYRWCSGSNVQDEHVEVTLQPGGSGTPVASGDLSAGTWSTSFSSHQDFGGSCASLFGADQTVTGTTDCTVGLILQASLINTLTSDSAFVDAASFTITYTPPGGGPSQAAVLLGFF